MKKTADGKYILSTIELAALIGASREQATKVWNDPNFDPSEDALPYIVDQGYRYLYGRSLYNAREKVHHNKEI